MATTSIIAGGTGDYTTIQSWEDNETAAGDIGEVQDSSTYDENVTISGGGGGRKVTVSSGNRHQLDKTGAVLTSSSSGHLMTVSEDDFTVEYLRYTDPVGSSSEGCRVNNTGFLAAWVYMHEFDAASEQDGIYTSTDGISFDVYGSVFVDMSRGGVLFQGSFTTGTTANITNCVAINCGQNTGQHVGGFGGDEVGSAKYDNCEMVCTNCFAETDASSSEDFDDADGLSSTLSFGASDYNAASDTSSPGTNSLDSRTLSDEFVSVTVGSEDVHLKDSTNTIADAGTDMSGTLTVDVEGDSFGGVGSWEMGADAEAAAGGNAMPMASNHYRQRRTV